jgi:cyclic-di-AMP phosphodiesterase PgpH
VRAAITVFSSDSMAISGNRRLRTTRTTTLRIANSPLQEFLAHLRQPGTLARLALSLATVAGLVIAVQGWKMPFQYRLGQRIPHGLAAKTDFQRVNRARTDRARQRAEESVPFFFRHDPAPLARLPGELRGALLPFSAAKSLDDLSPETRAAFGLVATSGVPTAAIPMKVVDRAQSFANLKRIASDDTLLGEVVQAFGGIVEPLSTRGLLRPEHLPNELGPGDAVAVINKEGGQAEAAVADIMMVPILSAGGLLNTAWEKFPVLLSLRSELENFLVSKGPETLVYDDAATQAARQMSRSAVLDIPEVFNRGNLLLGPGEAIDDAALSILNAEYEESERHVSGTERTVRVATTVALLVLVTVLNGYYLLKNAPGLALNTTRLAIYLMVIVLTVAAGRLLSYDPWRASVGPILACVMILSIAWTQVLAIITAFSLGLVVVLSTTGDLHEFVVLMSVCATAVVLLPKVSSRSTMVMVGFAAGGMYFITHWAVAMTGWGTSVVLDGMEPYVVWQDPAEWMSALRGAGWCVLAGFIVSGSLPFIETTFGVVTDISLLELGDVSHALLQELVRRAPGTYNHSMTVATLGETAADAIEANGLLVRVGAYFHDIGKMLKPQYFVENILAGTQNRHDLLNPAMSTLIIVGHVKDGIDLGLQHGLPQPLIDLIEQHHGTTLVEYFYRAATKQADADHRTDAEESHFRYPGPKPQSKEAAVLMIADACEGASRSLSEPTPKRLERLVQDIAMKRLLDGQFDECGLTLTELAMVQDSLTKSLIAVYHGRVKYPDQRPTKELRA